MNNIDMSYLLEDKEKIIYDNLLKVLVFKNITIEHSILIEYIRKHTLTNMYITTEILNTIIKECVNIQLERNKLKTDTITDMPDLSENNTKVLSSITKNIHSDIPKREKREEYIYIKGISGALGRFTNTFLLNKTFNNVESIELISGYINDHGGDPRGAEDEGNGVSGGLADNPVTSAGGDDEAHGFVVGDDSTWGSIGVVPFIWIDLVEPNIHLYSHYADYSVTAQASNCTDCSGNGASYCSTCGRTADTFIKCQPHGSFLVELKHYSFERIDSGAGLQENLIYTIDKTGHYIKKFTNLISINKFKINIRNIVGKPLWGCDNCLGENTDWQGSGNENKNLLRWEFIFKVTYYINTLENKFLLQN
jgi:hypothetical protein